MDIYEFLAWLVSGGGSVAVFSWFAERWPWFQALSSPQKFWSSMAASVALALGAWGVVSYVPPEILEQLSVPFSVVIGIVTIYLGKEGFHNQQKKVDELRNPNG